MTTAEKELIRKLVALTTANQFSVAREWAYSDWTKGIDYHCAHCDAKDFEGHKSNCEYATIINLAKEVLGD